MTNIETGRNIYICIPISISFEKIFSSLLPLNLSFQGKVMYKIL